ncbi:MAG: hypothetical protein IIC90_04500 [Chloroflexi bacterium]|nr:hypothetical protein [Chloroflexota bacterium]
MEQHTSGRSDNRLLRWAVAAAILGGAAIVVTLLILRAIPSEAEVEIEIAGWRVPVGVVISTDDVKSRLPGIVISSLLGDKPVIQINAGRVEQSKPGELTIQPLSGGKSVSYELTESTRILDIRTFASATGFEEGELAAVITSPGGNEAFLVLTGITRASD